MHVKGLSWVGVKTDKFDELTLFFRNVLNLPVMHEEQDFVVFGSRTWIWWRSSDLTGRIAALRTMCPRAAF